MKLQQLRYFVEAARCSSISKAAESLHVSQPSVSMAIHQLEQEFGVPLLTRRYQGFSLSPEGEALQEYAVGLLRQASFIQEQMHSLRSQQHYVRIGVPPMIGTLVLPKLYTEILQTYPNIQLLTEELGTQSLLRDLKADTLNLAILAHDSAIPKEFDSIPLYNLELIWCCMPTHFLADAKAIRVEDLRDEPLVLFEDNFCVRNTVNNMFESAGTSPYIVHSTLQLSTVQSMIQAEIATGFLFKPIAESISGLVTHSMEPKVYVQESLVWKKGGQIARETGHVIQLFRDTISQKNGSMSIVGVERKLR